MSDETATENTDTSAADAGADDNLLEAVAGKEADTSADTDATTTTDASDDDDADDLLEGKVSKDGEKEGEAEGASDDYELVAPDGFEADAELAETFKPVAKELGLTKDQAQGLVDKYAPKLLTELGERQAAQWKSIQKQWASEAKADPDFGGKNLDGSLAHVAVARDYLGADFTAAIKLLGGSNHPAVLKALAKVGQALGEDTPSFGKPVTTTTAEQRLYPNDQPKR